ncbi:bacterial SH3 domain-containing protein [Firmicutes bacterium CAG:534]|nr:bacterial SH3 domain-containing protein [Firmicutes bacterium CAG:534]
MKQSEQNKMHVLKEKFITARDWVMDHNKIVMPLVLVVCVLITVLVAVSANQRDALEKEAEQAAMAVNAEEAGSAVEGLESPVFELEENAYPDINNLVRTYYDAQAAGDMEVISKLNTYLNDIEKIRVQELSKYIESYPVLNVYTKPGLAENTYVAYVYSEVKFADMEQELPGMQTYYIGQDENGDYFINDGTYDDAIWSYIKDVTLQDDVVDLNNKVVVEYNDLLAEDEELSDFIAYLKEKINEDVGEILAQAETADTAQEAEAQEQETEEAQADEAQTDTVVKTVRATDVVNIRSSDSEEADKIGKAQIGEEFTLLEERGNGWSKIEYNGADAFIKSDYLEVVSEETVEASAETTQEQEAEPDAAQTASGTVKVKESVRIRKSASTDGEVLGTAYAGEEYPLLMKQADGWSKIEYKGQTAYVKSDYVE